MISKLIREDITEEAPGESPFCAHSFFIQKPNWKGLYMVMDYRDVSQLI